MAEYCDTPQSKERRNREHKTCLNERAILRLLDRPGTQQIDSLRSIGSNLRCSSSSTQTGGSSNQSKTTDDSKCQERSKSTKNQEVTSTPTDGSTPSKKPAKVPTGDSRNTIRVTRSDKLNNKLSNKPDELAEVVSVWPELPKAIRSAILAIVRASIDKQED